jgi:hypothetical protein
MISFSLLPAADDIDLTLKPMSMPFSAILIPYSQLTIVSLFVIVST